VLPTLKGVQDHDKAIYQKTGLGTRSALCSLGGASVVANPVSWPN
jgi:hypothetical protein